MDTTTPTSDPDALRDAVQDRYARAALSVRQSGAASCCGSGGPTSASTVPDLIGRGLYDADASGELPDDALAASLGCGNPTALAELRPGEVVLDLGSGGGIDVLLSARRVGATGKAYGLDMTPEMLALARDNAAEAGVDNVEFLEGTIESIPLPDESVDVIISNCVINLSGDKDAVLAEAFRVLRPGGRFAVSDIVLTRPLPAVVQPLMAAWTGCVAGALVDREYVEKLEAAGFGQAEVQVTQVFGADALARMGGDIAEQLPADTDLEALRDELDGAATSAFIRATKPAGGRG
jgi:2-polyprenyl-3-methyl-5-hydroxy-6-metoxy-1,4-benzoquinol methylase